MHWRSLLMMIIEKTMNIPDGIAKDAMIVASVIPLIPKPKKYFLLPMFG